MSNASDPIEPVVIDQAGCSPAFAYRGAPPAFCSDVARFTAFPARAFFARDLPCGACAGRVFVRSAVDALLATG